MAPQARNGASRIRHGGAKRYRILPLLAFAGFLLLKFSFSISVMSKLEMFDDESFVSSSAANQSNVMITDAESNESFNDAKVDSTKTPRGKLRYDWSNMTLTSPMAKRIESLMSNCSLPLGNTEMFNVNGLGAEVHIWSQKLCNSMEKKWRIRTVGSWQWLDESLCGNETTTTSIMNCYFPKAELRCPGDEKAPIMNENQTQSNPVPNPFITRCPTIVKNNGKLVSAFRASAMEYLFQSVHPAVIQEAERQLNLVFPQGKVPPNLITVHIRWGDKKHEMNLLPAKDYVKAVQEILKKRGSTTNETVSIFLATEDPKAVKAFQEAAPSEWAIYLDQYFHDLLPYRNTTADVYNQAPQSATDTKGRAGLIALASLLVAMEANDYVLTLASNWSRMMNELRKNILDPRCGKCTNMIDLRRGEW